MTFLGLMVRCKDEPYVAEFVSYYLGQGVDKIYIIDDHSRPNTYEEAVRRNPRVSILFNLPFAIDNASVQPVYEKIKAFHEWLICVDMDEYITTKRDKNKTIREELETTFANADCVKIPWVLMSCNSIPRNPPSLLNSNTYRWNHDRRHPNRLSTVPKFRCRYDFIEVKCIFRPKCFATLNVHHPERPVKPTTVVVVESIHNRAAELTPFYANLRESDIEQGILCCYHYRIVSVEQCMNKIKPDNKFYCTFTLEDVMSFDYPEIIDETLKIKVSCPSAEITP